ncbi:MAG: hypothetical protein ACSHWQ_06570 [Spongiibacteraceae bacterium]
MPKQHTISCADGHPIVLSLFEAEQPRGVVVIGGALGVPQQYYARMAAFLRKITITVFVLVIAAPRIRGPWTSHIP